ncbi:hypothetical protein BGW38_007164, partial [Lunasporangiospora selenospora]
PMLTRSLSQISTSTSPCTPTVTEWRIWALRSFWENVQCRSIPRVLFHHTEPRLS